MSIRSLPVAGNSGTVVSSHQERLEVNTVESFETYRSYLFSIA